MRFKLLKIKSNSQSIVYSLSCIFEYFLQDVENKISQIMLDICSNLTNGYCSISRNTTAIRSHINCSFDEFNKTKLVHLPLREEK